jgi:hypothetical protein
MKHLTMAELEAGLDEIRKSPKDAGALELIVRRPRIEEREVLQEGELHLTDGLVGDGWSIRGSSDGRRGGASRHANQYHELRVIALLAGTGSAGH